MRRRKLGGLRRRHQEALLASALGLALLGAASAVPAQVDTSAWKCANCPAPSGVSGEVELGLGVVSDDSFRFGNYTGLEEDGAYLIAGSRIPYAGDDGRYFDLSVLDLGLDSRALSFEGGRQGRYSLALSYDEMPYLLYDTTATPFLGVGSSQLTLPDSWVNAGNTRNMPLASTLVPVEIARDSDTLGLGFSWLQSSRLEWTVDYQRREKNGTEMLGAAFLTASSILPAPVDYTTDEVEAGVAYTGERWYARAAYHGSFFNDGNAGIVWENPYNPFGLSGDSGRIAAPPDNRFQSLSLSGAYRLGAKTSVAGSVSTGRVEQDESFLPYTINPDVVTMPLPSASLDGEVDTFDLSARVTTRPLSGLRLSAEYFLRDRDNNTPQQIFTPVEWDIALGDPRMNLPYSFEREGFDLQADYRVPRWGRLYVGFDRLVMKRTLQEVERTEEDDLWGRVLVTPHPRLEASLQVSREERNGSEYRVLDENGAPQNPLLRKFNMADKDRDAAELYLSVQAHEWLNLGFGAEQGRDDYPDTQIGLFEADYDTYTADLTVAFPEHVNLYTAYTREEYDSKQASSEGFAEPDWLARVQDVTDTLSFGVEARELIGKVDMGLDFTYSESVGQVVLDTLATAPPFPDLLSRLNTVRFYLHYPLRPQLTLQFGYIYERYRSGNWPIDGVEPDTIGNVLSLGEDSFNYDVNLISVSAHYTFSPRNR